MQIDVVAVRRTRLAALGLTRPRGGVAAAVRGVLALQAQDLRQAEWAIGSRVPGSSAAEVWAAFDAGAVVRSWPVRGTLFALAPADLRLLLSLTAERQQRTAEPRHRQLGLTEEQVGRAGDVARAELAGGGAMTRPELLAAWTAAGVDTTGQRGPHLYGRLAHRGLLCLGPARGATAGGPQQAFVLLDEWAPGQAPDDRAAAVAELVRRYLAGHGPASERDLSWWSGLTLTEVRAGFAAVREELTELHCGDRVLWTLGEPLPAEPDGVRALAGFDELLLGHTDRSFVVAPDRFDAVVPGGNGVFLPMLVADGEVVGTWRTVRGAVQFDPDVPGAADAVAVAQRFRS
ncbi:winged helix DNA-binding domain-containing protein [Klenkia brasiliensis]|uniref:Winged helix DNA-binding domain-containing protein n=1 Tax=Klenkia brasiliensis TaxID=333142 RepID=A0A1G7YUA6_9ACTN|nr:winged helix DNA-binding domain-containing protein [Klenkia brasiliensis]SDH00014.1 Winged helix DNA-binding domain-containing protein [Klenkia brasiliensis]